MVAEEEATPPPTGPGGVPAGVIIPPPELKTIIDKAASFVSRIGLQFERKLHETEKNNPKFGFLDSSSHYHNYYQFMKTQGGTGEEEEAKKGGGGGQEENKKEEESGGKTEEKAMPAKPLKPPPKPEFLAESPLLSALDLDIMKLTAQFVARNGQAFQVGLLNREHRNPQFDFLKPTNTQHNYFNHLSSCYSKILLPPREIAQTLRSQASSKHQLLDSILDWVEYEKMQASLEGDPDEAKEQEERMARAMIDWHDFVIVETITFDDDDEAAPAKQEEAEDMEMEDDEMEIEQPTLDSNLKIRKEVVHSANVLAKTTGRSIKYQVCPKCKQEIPVDEMTEHLRIELMDPNFQVQKKEWIENKKNVNTAKDDSIFNYLKSFADRRTDIFGQEDELAIGQKRGTQGPKEATPKADKLIWDGHSSSINRTAADAMEHSIKTAQVRAEETQAKLAAASGVSMPPAQGQGHQPPQAMGQPHHAPQAPPAAAPRMMVPGVPYPFNPHMYSGAQMGMYPGMARPPVHPHVPPAAAPPPSAPTPTPAQAPPPPPAEEVKEPPAKKQKVEEDTGPKLVPEKEFLEANKGPISISVIVPKDPKSSSWKLEGQTLSISLELSSKVSELKKKIAEQVGMPANKQKLKADNLPFLKDQLSLAYYNLTAATPLQLGVKERGGRRN